MHEIHFDKVASCDMTWAEYLTKRQKSPPPIGIELDWQTNTTENITFLQTMYTGGNNPL